MGPTWLSEIDLTAASSQDDGSSVERGLWDGYDPRRSSSSGFSGFFEPDPDWPPE